MSDQPAANEFALCAACRDVVDSILHSPPGRARCRWGPRRRRASVPCGRRAAPPPRRTTAGHRGRCPARPRWDSPWAAGRAGGTASARRGVCDLPTCRRRRRDGAAISTKDDSSSTRSWRPVLGSRFARDGARPKAFDGVPHRAVVVGCPSRSQLHALRVSLVGGVQQIGRCHSTDPARPRASYLRRSVHLRPP
jgi:hypothetical protein